MTQKTWLMNARPQSVVDAVRQYGMIAFLVDGGTDMSQTEVATVATSAISYLDEKVSELTSFLSTSSHDDISVDSVIYSFWRVGEANFGMLRKTVTHAMGGEKIINGPIVDCEKAWKLVPILNQMFGKNFEVALRRFVGLTE